MLKGKSPGFKILFFIFLFFVVIKLATLITSLCCVVFYIKKTYTQSAIIHAIIIALLADFVSNLIIWGLNRALKLLSKPASWALLLSPALLLVMVLLSFTAEPESEESSIVWGLPAAYLLIIDVFLAKSLIKIKQRLAKEEKPGEKTVLERIRTAKK